MKQLFAGICLLLIAGITGCRKDNNAEVDTEYPIIDLSGGDAFPKQCSVITRGQKLTFSARFGDNVELGSYSIDTHHNFDHHSHSTEANDCALDGLKTPVRPLLIIKQGNIPAGQTSFAASLDIDIPLDVDAGDYHFLIRLTDKTGWQTIKGLSIKIK